jgi:hypothetical protein
MEKQLKVDYYMILNILITINRSSSIIINQMKAILIVLMLAVVTFAQSPALIACIEAKCPDQYAKCKSTSGCEDKLKKCANQCGEKVAQTCWTLCLGLPGAAANVALCAVNQGCLAGEVTMIDRIGLNLMTAIETYMEQ